MPPREIRSNIAGKKGPVNERQNSNPERTCRRIYWFIHTYIFPKSAVSDAELLSMNAKYEKEMREIHSNLALYEKRATDLERAKQASIKKLQELNVEQGLIQALTKVNFCVHS